MQQQGQFKTIHHFKFLGNCFIFAVIAVGLYFHIGKFWHLSTNFSLLNFAKTQGKIINVYNATSTPSYLIEYKRHAVLDTARLEHSNYFTDHFEKGDTLSVYVSTAAVRVPKVDNTDHYIWFLLFCFGICAYISAISLRKHLFKT